MTIRADSALASAESNRHSSTLVACSENRAKLTPAPSNAAPSGYDCPGQTRIQVTSGIERPTALAPIVPIRITTECHDRLRPLPAGLPVGTPRQHPAAGD